MEVELSRHCYSTVWAQYFDTLWSVSEISCYQILNVHTWFQKLYAPSMNHLGITIAVTFVGTYQIISWNWRLRRKIASPRYYIPWKNYLHTNPLRFISYRIMRFFCMIDGENKFTKRFKHTSSKSFFRVAIYTPSVILIVSDSPLDSSSPTHDRRWVHVS